MDSKILSQTTDNSVQSTKDDMPIYPFSAVCGQATFKLALMLVAINPAIGGVVVSGPRGSAKSTLARGMADLLHHAEFVTLPLGASEEMLIGTLDLEQVLNEKKLQFSPGLLSKAHEGVLYVDEVNLLPDNLVDLLLDVATSGLNCVERDGISHRHAANFILLGTMNPDEGELRPQLLDRFGLSVQLDAQPTTLERVEIVKRREAFEESPQALLEQFAAEQQNLMARLDTAKALLNKVTCADDLRVVIAERCQQAQVDGLRADIVWFRAAKAHAALQGRTVVTLDDIDTVEALVLHHRRQAPQDNSKTQNQNDQRPPAPQDQQPPRFKRPPERPLERHKSRNSQEQHDQQQHDQQEQQQQKTSLGEWGTMPAQQQRTATGFELTLDINAQSLSFDSQKRTRHSKQPSFKPDWFRSLLGSLPAWPPKTLRFKTKRQGHDCLHLVLLDTSASTLEDQSFAYSKAVLLNLSEQAYLKREKLAVFGFGNHQVEPLLSCVRAPKTLKTWLDSLGAGGGTPMRDVFETAQTYIQQMQRKTPTQEIRCYVLTDGRSTASLEGIRLPETTVWIDTELSTIKCGRGQQLAADIFARYLPIQQLLTPVSGDALLGKSDSNSMRSDVLPEPVN